MDQFDFVLGGLVVCVFGQVAVCLICHCHLYSQTDGKTSCKILQLTEICDPVDNNGFDTYVI